MSGGAICKTRELIVERLPMPDKLAARQMQKKYGATAAALSLPTCCAIRNILEFEKTEADARGKMLLKKYSMLSRVPLAIH